MGTQIVVDDADVKTKQGGSAGVRGANVKTHSDSANAHRGVQWHAEAGVVCEDMRMVVEWRHSSYNIIYIFIF